MRVLLRIGVIWFLLILSFPEILSAQDSLYNNNYNQTTENKISFTEKEQAWLKAHPVITLGGGIFPPLEFFDEEKGESVGIGPDYAKLIGNMLGIEFNLVSDDWYEIQQRAKAKDIDGIRFIFKNKEREEYLNYTQP